MLTSEMTLDREARREANARATEVPLWRLYALRAAYLLLVVGLGIEIWPGIIRHEKPWELMYGVVQCVLAAVSLLALLGLRYPLQMLPLLFFEIVWKSDVPTAVRHRNKCFLPRTDEPTILGGDLESKAEELKKSLWKIRNGK